MNTEAQIPNILLVDDDLLVLKSIAPFLESLGYHVTTAESGEDAIELLNRSTFDLVITDLIMGNVDGYQVLEMGKNLRSEMMFIVLTGNSNPTFIINALRLGADDYLVKPCEPEEMRFRVERCFEKLESKKKAKQAEEALRESEEQYRTLVDNLPVAVYRNTPGPEGAFIMANPAFCKMFGFKNEEEVKKVTPASLYQNPEERKQYSDNLIQKGVFKNDERALQKRDGTPVYTSITSRVMYRKDGEISYFDSMMLDITEKKLAEERLRESVQKYRSLFEESKDAIVFTTQQGYFIDANSAASELFGYTKEEILKLNFRKLYVDPDERYRFQEEMKEKDSVQGFETKLRGKGDVEMDCIFDVVCRQGDNESILEYQGIIRDISEAKRAQEELKTSQQLSIPDN